MNYVYLHLSSHEKQTSLIFNEFNYSRNSDISRSKKIRAQFNILRWKPMNK